MATMGGYDWSQYPSFYPPQPQALSPEEFRQFVHALALDMEYIKSKLRAVEELYQLFVGNEHLSK